MLIRSAEPPGGLAPLVPRNFFDGDADRRGGLTSFLALTLDRLAGRATGRKQVLSLAPSSIHALALVARSKMFMPTARPTPLLPLADIDQ